MTSRAAVLALILVSIIVWLSFEAPAAAPYLGFGLAGLAFYAIPIAAATGRKGGAGPQVLGLLLGWTGLGWIIALAWALSLPKLSDVAAERFEQLPDGTFRRVTS